MSRGALSGGNVVVEFCAVRLIVHMSCASLAAVNVMAVMANIPFVSHGAPLRSTYATVSRLNIPNVSTNVA